MKALLINLISSHQNLMNMSIIFVKKHLKNLMLLLINDVPLMSLLLKLETCFTPFSSVSTVRFEEVNVYWKYYMTCVPSLFEVRSTA